MNRYSNLKRVVVLAFFYIFVLGSLPAVAVGQQAADAPAVQPGQPKVNLEGTWLGAITVGKKDLRLVFKIKTDPQGNLTAEMDSIDQGIQGVPVDKIEIDKDIVKINAAMIGGLYEGKFVDQVGIEGEWQQGGYKFPLLLQKVDKAPELPARFRDPIKLDPAIYDQYVGVYELQPGETFTVTKENDKLFVQLTGNPKAEIFPESEVKFFIKVIDGDIEFVKDEQGKVFKIKFRHGRVNVEAKRIQ